MSSIVASGAAPLPGSTAENWRFLVIVDDTPECDNALRFAALRAAKTNGGVTLLYIIDPPDFQHWMSVEDVMREEARAEADIILKQHADQVCSDVGIDAQMMVREGKAIDVILEVIKEDPGIRILVLAAGTGGEGPGPLISSFTGKFLNDLPIAMTIVPGHLKTSEIDQIT